MAFRFTPSARVTVNVTSSQKAVAGATVTLNSSDGTVLYTAVTNNKELHTCFLILSQMMPLYLMALTLQRMLQD